MNWFALICIFNLVLIIVVCNLRFTKNIVAEEEVKKLGLNTNTFSFII